WSRPLLRAFRKRISYTSLLIGGTGLTLAVYVAKDALIPQLNNWGLETIICATAFAAPVIVAIQLGALSLLRLGKNHLRARIEERKHARPEAAAALPTNP